MRRPGALWSLYNKPPKQTYPDLQFQPENSPFPKPSAVARSAASLVPPPHVTSLGGPRRGTIGPARGTIGPERGGTIPCRGTVCREISRQSIAAVPALCRANSGKFGMSKTRCLHTSKLSGSFRNCAGGTVPARSQTFRNFPGMIVPRAGGIVPGPACLALKKEGG